MSKRLRDSEGFPEGSRVEILLSGVKKLRGKIAWSAMSKVMGFTEHAVLRVDYDLGGWFIFVVSPAGESALVEAKIVLITNEGAQLELL
jgi:hypothetical protein